MALKTIKTKKQVWVCDICGQKYDNWGDGMARCDGGQAIFDFCFREICPDCRIAVSVNVGGLIYQGRFCKICYPKKMKILDRILRNFVGLHRIQDV